MFRKGGGMYTTPYNHEMIVIQQPKILLQMVLILNSFFHILFEFCPYHYIDGCLDGLCGEKVQFGSFTHR